jgi:hypothetical protein
MTHAMPLPDARFGVNVNNRWFLEALSEAIP